MLPIQDPLEYFCELEKLAQKATQFPWDRLNEEYCSKLTLELRRLIQRTDSLHFKAEVIDSFFRNLLAEYSPPNSAFYMHPRHSLDWVIERDMWNVWSVLRMLSLPGAPKPVRDAALTACHASRKSCEILVKKMRESEAQQRALLPAGFLPSPEKIGPPPRRNFEPRVVGGRDFPHQSR